MSLIPTTLSPLQLKAHSFPIVSVRANPNGKPTNFSTLDQQVSCLPVPGVPNNWNLQLAMKHTSADPNNPFCYEVEICAVGVVEISEQIAPEKRETIVAVNGLGLLYSACREMLLNVTSRSIFGAFSLPSLNFSKVLQDAKVQQAPSSDPKEACKA
jgi:preprotein translocase subunit SecB